jgi:hypothetical protein
MSNLGAAPPQAVASTGPGGELFRGFSSITNRVGSICLRQAFRALTFPSLGHGSIERRRNRRSRTGEFNLRCQELPTCAKGFDLDSISRGIDGSWICLVASFARHRRLSAL